MSAFRPSFCLNGSFARIFIVTDTHTHTHTDTHTHTQTHTHTHTDRHTHTQTHTHTRLITLPLRKRGVNCLEVSQIRTLTPRRTLARLEPGSGSGIGNKAIIISAKQLSHAEEYGVVHRSSNHTRKNMKEYGVLHGERISRRQGQRRS